MLYIDLINKHNTLFDRKVYKIKVKSHQTFICQLAPRPPTLPYTPCSRPSPPPRSFLTNDIYWLLGSVRIINNKYNTRIYEIQNQIYIYL